MSLLDWIVLVITLAAMIGYGMYKGRGQDGAHSYLLAGKQMPWYVVLLGVMATQASAITFLSAPGLAYNDGMRFVQNYFGLPLAMVVICITFIPVFSRLNVYTAYEYLEQRFDRRTRVFTSLLFLLSRGLSTGISIYAPSIILSSMLGWNIYLTNVVMGGLLMVYTYSGGARAVAHTQKLQFLVILAAMGLAGYLVVRQLPAGIGFSDAVFIAGKAGKLNIITTRFDWHDKYNIWSGVIGGFFLALSYFGTDHSQVGRYITASSTRESRLGLLLNGLVKIPMQFLILSIGVLVFVLYSIKPGALYFNDAAYTAYATNEPQKAAAEQSVYRQLQSQSESYAIGIAEANKTGNTALLTYSAAAYKNTQQEIKILRDSVARHIAQQHYAPDKNDSNYIFLYFVKNSLPKGIVGLLFAVIILASWGSISAALNSLAASSLMDMHIVNRATTKDRELRLGRLHTLAWSIFCVGVAMFAAQMGSLIEAVNVLGSLFYGTILGIFLVAFYMKKVGGKRVFYAAIVTEVLVVAIYTSNIVSFLWLNVIGALLVMLFCAPVYLSRSTSNS
jgi:Na+/proline symporter